ncbi:ATP-dependent helicase [Clostridium sp. CM028]|uniref:ATP-dependent helicase n=1 Tax=Clostridium sp. CM028 TaxID=2851575 RepID=UPI001C6EFBB2|nr:ATP-dependent helicase [Clostridium sp. CM028]MBW9148276.1 ATP-dependent helicase [Clostridium sp. CM028]WLC62385.1 ATP-dependent helicase [Clostridium sp. CM028]
MIGDMSNEEVKISYRDDQLHIMEYRGGTMAVPAVPGAGKTFIICNLVCELIEDKIHKPGKILIVTFMNSAVNNFKHRISIVLQNKGITASNDYEVMTIHSLALKILKDRPDVVGVNEEFKILDDVNKSLYLNKCIMHWRRNGGENIFKAMILDKSLNKYPGKQNDWWNDFFTTVDTIIGELKINDISPEKLKDEVKNLNQDSILNYISEIYDSYTKTLKREGYIDYNDLLILAYKLLKTDDVLREKLNVKYTFVFEDECQDSNLIQGRILGLISGKNGNLVRVGDVNQSITGTFTSSDPKFFREFCENANKKFEMYMAGRSTKHIIDLANELVRHINNHHGEEKCRCALVNQEIKTVPEFFKLKKQDVDIYGISTMVCSSNQDEINKATKLTMKFKEKYPNKTCAILVPYNNQVKEIADKLRELNIECDELSNKSDKRCKAAFTLGYILQFISEPHDSFKFKDLVKNVFIEENNEESERLFDFIQDYKVEKLMYPNGGVIDQKDVPREILGSEVYQKFIKCMQQIKIIFQYPQTHLDRLILHISDVLNFSLEDRAMADAVASYIRFLSKDESDFCLKHIVDQLLDEKNGILNHISGIIYDLEGYEPSSDRITVSTCHKAKGLEWDCVFILSITSYQYPYMTTDKFREYYYLKQQFKNPTVLCKAEIAKILGNNICEDPIGEAKIQIINEKIRLLYVGITRAKEYLILMASKCNEGKWNESKPSKYFYVLQDYINSQRGDGKC